MSRPVLPPSLCVLPEQGYLANHYALVFPEGICLIEAALSPQTFEASLSAYTQGQAPLPPVRRIILTHGHFDHLGALMAWKQQSPCPEVYCPLEEAPYLHDASLNGFALFHENPTLPEADHYYQEGDVLPLFEDHVLEVWHTPGHTPGSSCLLWRKGTVPQAIFTGDTVIGTSIGRTDFKGSNPEHMAQSLRRLAKALRTLPPDLPFLAGHGAPHRVQDILRHNPWLRLEA